MTSIVFNPEQDHAPPRGGTLDFTGPRKKLRPRVPMDGTSGVPGGDPRAFDAVTRDLSPAGGRDFTTQAPNGDPDFGYRPPSSVRQPLAATPTPTGYTGNQGADYLAAAKEAQRAISEEAGEDLQKAIGSRLGDLNAIGALRSGATSTAIRDIAGDYSKNVSRAGAANALQVMQMRDEAMNAAARTAAMGQMADADRSERALMREEDTRRFEAEFGEGRRRFNTESGLAEREFGEGTRRFDLGYGLEREQFGEGRRQYDTTLGFQKERAGRGDFESDRDFTRTTGRDTRADYESDRGFGFQQERAKREDFTSDRDYAEYQRQFNLQRADQRAAEKRAAKASRWGVFGRLAGNVAGTLVGRANSGQ